MKYFIIDGLNLAYRSHLANFSLTTVSGNPSGMFFGFIRTLFSLKKRFRSYSFSVAWDNKPTHKYDIQPDYKAGRTPLPSSVFSQVEDIRIFLSNVGVEQYEAPGQEADDVIASLVDRFKDSDAEEIIVYSNDKDMLQLVESGKVIVFKPKVSQNPEKFFDTDAVVERFGVPPERLSSYRSLDGDDSDNITGIPYVPRKVLASLVNEYGDLESIYNALEGIKLTEKQRQRFNESKDRITNNYKLIRLNRDLKNIQQQEGTFDKVALEELVKKYNIKTINVDNMVDLFSSSLNVRYSDPQPTYELESFSLFE